MADPDAVKAGGATGALQRATQLANQRATNALRVANSLRRKRNPPRPRVPRGGRQLPGGGEGRVLPPAFAPPASLPVPQQLPLPSGKPKKPADMLDLAPPQGPGQPQLGGLGEILDIYTNPNPADVPDTTTPRVVDPATGKPGTPLPGTAGPGYIGLADWQVRDAGDVNRYTDNLSPEEQAQVRKNVKEVQGEGKVAKTIKQMVEDIKKDPLQDSERFLAGNDLANAFRDESKFKYYTNQDLAENPLLATLNDLSVWSTYRLKTAEWNKNKKKTGDVDLDEGGDGTYAGIVDSGSFASVTGPGNLSPYIVTRDESGLLQVVTADQWIQAKFAQMRHDPEFAANMITALAMTSAYGTDSAANNQRSRIVTDPEGNPVKAFVSAEDLAALKQLANQVAILQNQGDEVAIDDSIAELTAMASDVTMTAAANGDFGGGGSGGGGWGYGGGGGGYGGGYGGGGGGSGAVRYTDATQLTSLVGSIGRQRMGRELTPEESAQFVAYYHKLEEQSTAAYYAGQSNTQLDPEGQAVAWLTSHFQRDAAAHQYGNLAASFMAMMGSQNPFAGIT